MTEEAPPDPLKAHPDNYSRSVLITGAGQRIGRIIAQDFARRSWRVAVHYRHSQAEAEALVAEIKQAGGEAVALAADLALESQSQDLIARATAALGPLGCLVNNASVFEHDTMESATRDSWDRHMETNLRAPFVLMQNFARALPPDQGGLIINILDQRVWDLPPDYVSYSLSKSGLWSLTRSLARALAPRIRVNAIGPGYAYPEKGVSWAAYDQFVAQLPLGRGTDPQEICAAIRFFIEAKSITGQMLAMDGGEYLA